MLSQLRYLPTPTADNWDWQIMGLCRGEDSSVFFHPEGERGRARTLRENRAKAICEACPVLQECRNHALTVGEPYGVWGGLSETERNNILKTRGRNRRLAAKAS